MKTVALMFCLALPAAAGTISYDNIPIPRPTAINDAGAIVGVDPFTEQSYVYSGGALTSLSAPGMRYTEAYSISDAGVVAGAVADQSWIGYGFTETGGVFTTFMYPGAGSTAVRDIADSGTLYGEYQQGSGCRICFFYGFSYANGVYTSLNYPGAEETFLSAANDAGDFVGTFHVEGQEIDTAFLGYKGAWTELQFPAAKTTVPTGINDNGEVVGYYLDSHNHAHGFTYFEGVWTSYQWTGISVNFTGINNVGQIVGEWSSNDGYPRSGFISPGSTTKPPVTPEPSTIALLVLGLLLVVGRYRKALRIS
jgi:PEP-CTERM motif